MAKPKKRKALKWNGLRWVALRDGRIVENMPGDDRPALLKSRSHLIEGDEPIRVRVTICEVPKRKAKR